MLIRSVHESVYDPVGKFGVFLNTEQTQSSDAVGSHLASTHTKSIHATRHNSKGGSSPVVVNGFVNSAMARL